MADGAKQWDLEHTEPQTDEEFMRRRAQLRARYYSVKCSTYSKGRTRPVGATSGRSTDAPADGEPPSPRLPTTSWKRIREAIGVVKGLPAGVSQPLTADDLFPLIAKLSPADRRRLFRLIQKVGNDTDAYRATPPEPSEFSSDEDMLAWDADGWENMK